MHGLDGQHQDININIYNLLLCFIPLEMHVRLMCAIKFYLLTSELHSFTLLTDQHSP